MKLTKHRNLNYAILHLTINAVLFAATSVIVAGNDEKPTQILPFVFWMVAVFLFAYVYLYLYSTYFKENVLVRRLVLFLMGLFLGGSSVLILLRYQSPEFLLNHLLLLFILITLFVVSFGFLIRNAFDFHNKYWEMVRSGEKLRDHNEFLQRQLDPHFLFNMLNNIASAIVIDPETALDFTYKNADLLREHFKVINKANITYSELIYALRLFISVQQYSIGERYSITFTEDIDNPDLVTPPYIIQPLIHNVIRLNSSNPDREAIKIELIMRSGIVQLDIMDYFSKPFIQKKNVDIAFDDYLQRMHKLFNDRFTLKSDYTGKVHNTHLTINYRNVF